MKTLAPKRAILTLTRGYSDFSSYEALIARNRALSLRCGNDPIDHLIFHEGNITLLQQFRIRCSTPKLRIRFVDVKARGKAFCDGRTTTDVYEPTKPWPAGYRHMCSFWFVDFWNFVTNYDQVIRIDEDCIIDFRCEDIFNLLDENTVSVYGGELEDQEFVTVGLNEFTLNFLKTEKQIGSPRNPIGPYTNVIAFNLRELRNNSLLLNYIDRVRDSNRIYSHRWGDLPLWGEALHYFFPENSHYSSEMIQYYHGSHSVFVGSGAIHWEK